MSLNIKNVGFLHAITFLLTLYACTPDIILPLDPAQVDSPDMGQETYTSENIMPLDPTQAGFSDMDQGTLTAENIEEVTTSSLPQINPDIVWFAGHETGDLSEWNRHGGFIRQGSGSYNFVSPHAHTGNFSVALTIDTIAPSSTGSHASYLFFWDQLSDDAYYYSAWYYIPSGIRPSKWWNIWQWKSTYNGNSDDSKPMFSLDVTRNGENLSLSLYQRPDDPNKIKYEQYIMNLPTDTWFQIEAFYKRSKDSTGEVIIWQDGVELFNITGATTVLANNNIQWSINNYAHTIDPSPCTIYIDDAAISKSRLGIINRESEP